MSNGAQDKGERLHRLVLYVNADEYSVVQHMAANYRPPLVGLPGWPPDGQGLYRCSPETGGRA